MNMYADMYVCIYMCMYIYIYMYTHVLVYMWARSTLETIAWNMNPCLPQGNDLAAQSVQQPQAILVASNIEHSHMQIFTHVHMNAHM